ncbi:TPA: hypothetical protein ACW0SX_004304 [Enterobacter soli]
MKKSSIFSVAAGLPQLWQSRILGQVGDASIKVISYRVKSSNFICDLAETPP